MNHLVALSRNIWLGRITETQFPELFMETPFFPFIFRELVPYVATSKYALFNHFEMKKKNQICDQKAFRFN
jgi:hypothetical protein